MTRKIFIFIITCLLSFCHIQPGHALFIREYTEENPLVIVSDWEFPPYEFRNDKGEPDGYNVEVLNLILNRLNIPHKYVMQEWNKCTGIFENREADLIHALTFMYAQRPFVMTQNMITYYNVKAARLKTTPPLEKISQLSDTDTLILKDNDYAALRVSEYEGRECQIEFRSTKDALAGVRSGKYKYYIWGEKPLILKMKEYGMSDLVLDETDIPAGELRIIGYDKELIDAIDDTYARLEQAGALQKIHDKWFYPERVHNDTSPVTLFILSGIIILSIIGVLLSFLVRSRVRNAVNKTLDLNQMMTQALNMGDFYVTEYDLKTGHTKNIYGHLLPDEGLDMKELCNCFHPEDQGEMDRKSLQKKSEALDRWPIHRRWNIGTKENPVWRCLRGYTIVEKEDGKPRFIVNSIHDVTKEIEEEVENSTIGSKYQKMFDTNLLAMSFYDKNGNLLDINENMQKLCELNEEREKFFRQTNLFNISLIKGVLTPETQHDIHLCQRMFYPEIGIDKYIEFRIRIIRDSNGAIHYYIASARDMTQDRAMYLELRKHDKEIRKSNEAINLYENQLHYLLENSNMFIWNFYPEDSTIRFSRSVRNQEYSETLEEFFEGVEEDKRIKAIKDINNCVAERKPYHAVHYYKYTPVEHRPVWYSISGIPIFDKDGSLIRYFGIARSITDIMEAQEKLLKETERAENSGKMKSAFLANMTHEIRTPLNAIVGFSSLLPMAESKEERMEFIRIIRNNCDMLIRLINDILEASSMGQALAIEPTEVDFAKDFDDICQTLAQRVQEAGVEFIKDNPYETFPATLDMGRIQQVLTNFTTNAVKYTKEGHIKVGYREQDDGIYLYCEDTGAGIPKEKQASIFERFVKLNDFVQGTGLGLSICKSIAERCGGKIGVISEGEGHGSTFWFWTPRHITPPTNNG